MKLWKYSSQKPTLTWTMARYIAQYEEYIICQIQAFMDTLTRIAEELSLPIKREDMRICTNVFGKEKK